MKFLDDIYCDLGNPVLMQLRPHFMFQSRRVYSIGEIQEKYHPSFVLVQGRTLNPALMRNKQRLHGIEHRSGIFSVVQSNSYLTARVRIQPKHQ